MYQRHNVQDALPVMVYFLPKDQQMILEQLRKKIKKDHRGKPFLKEYKDCWISISHSGDYAALAISDCNVGIDFQKFEPKENESVEEVVKRQVSIAKRFFHEKEYEFIVSDSRDSNRISRFFNIWTAKESYVKYTGNGIGDDFGNFNVVSPCIESGEWSAEGVCFASFQCSKAYTLCVCTKERREVLIKKLGG